MKPLRDPERAQLNHLRCACELEGKVVLEIGSGDGTFTRQYARWVNKVVGIDPALSELQVAYQKAQFTKQFYIQCKGENLPFHAHTFDIVIFGSSL